MNSAAFNGRELSPQLLRCISSKDQRAINFFSDLIFSEIKKLAINGLYGLSIALTNYYFETFWFASLTYIKHGMAEKGLDTMLWSCDNVWKQEDKLNYKFHKGTPYFFLGRCYLMNGNLDLGFQMVHAGHTENLEVYPKLNGDYRTAPSFLFMTMNKNNLDNNLYDYVTKMERKLMSFIEKHNTSASSPTSYETFDKKFLQRHELFDEVKFVLAYLLMNLTNLDKHDTPSLNDNPFSNIRKIDLMRSLSLIVDKTLAEKYGTDGIDAGVFEYFKDKLFISENKLEKFLDAISYCDKSPFKMRRYAERNTKEILSNGLKYNGSELSYPMKCMMLAWVLRNFSAHNLSGINQLLNDYYQKILSVLFSALFFTTEIL